MLNRIFTLITTLLFTLLFSISAHSAWWPFSSDGESGSTLQEPDEIMWDELIPNDFIQPENPFITMPQDQVDKLMDGSDESKAELARLEEAFNYAPVVPELDGRRIKIPAYITPLEFNADSMIKEFLLVPYVGACMHTPPPPANQIVFAEISEAMEFKGMYEPVWAIGTIRTESVQSELAESGYRLEVEEIRPYSSEKARSR